MRFGWSGPLALLLGTPAAAAVLSHPCLYQTPADIQRARANIQRYPWAQRLFERIRSNADLWAGKSEAELRGIIPPKGSLFAYGFSGCPLCKSSWSSWGAGGVGDFSHPGQAKCPKCGHLFPDAEHPDDGQGWTDPETGKKYYFVGVYNAYVAQRVTLNVLDDLSSAYAITGEEKYARAAATLLDAVASIYPTTTIGSSDYPGADQPGAMGGRLERPQYQVARVLVHFARYYDLLYNSPELDRPSVEPGVATIRKNIEQNILRDGGAYCWKMGTDLHMGLTNGQADYVRGVIAAGLMLKDQEYLKWALEGPTSVYSFLDNNLDKDGLYYETSTLYSEHAISLYVDMANMLINLKSPEHPKGINLFEHPKLRPAMLEALLQMNCAGHLACFGDTSPDLETINSPRFCPPRSEAYFFAEQLYARSKGAEADRLWSILEQFCDGDVEAYRENLKADGIHRWLLFHGGEPRAEKRAPEPYHQASGLLGGKGIAVLRSGEGSDAHALLLRYGPCLNHGHFDDLGVSFYALGRELTYDLGYSLGSSHVQVGWAKQTVAHNLVVVNETSQLKAGPTGGDPTVFASVPSLQVVEATSDSSYKSEGVTEYRRAMAMVDLAPGSFYLLDLFRVAGGKTHDQSWHFAGSLEKVDGAELGEAQAKGSLAGPEYDWGVRIGPDGDVIGKDAGGPYWNPPPGNGYGFLHQVRQGEAGNVVQLFWKINDKAGLRATLLPSPNSTLITAHAPGILPALPGADYAILRRQSPSSVFVSLLEPVRGESAIQQVDRLEDGDLTGARVRTRTGREDILLTSTRPETAHTLEVAGEQVSFSGRFGFIAKEPGGARRLLLVGGKKLAAGGLLLTAKTDGYSGTISRIAFAEAKLYTTAELPPVLVGQTIYLSRPEYSHVSPYTIAGVRKVGKLTEIALGGVSLLLGRGTVGDGPGSGGFLPNKVPLEQSTSMLRLETEVFRGKRIVNERTGKADTVEKVGVRNQPNIWVKNPSLFRAGDPYVIYDLQAGDRFSIPSQIELRPEGGTYRLIANVPVTFSNGKYRKAYSPGDSPIKAF